MRSATPGMALLVSLVAGAACSHVVMIKTTPPGATVRVDGEIKGVTPLMFEEATGFGRRYELDLQLDGFQPEKISVEQSEWWPSCVWPSLCLLPLTCGLSGVGLFFSRSLRDEYHYMLRPMVRISESPTPIAPPETPHPAGDAPASDSAASATSTHSSSPKPGSVPPTNAAASSQPPSTP